MHDLLAIGIVLVLLVATMLKSPVKQEVFTFMTLLLLSAVSFVLLNPLVSFGITFLPRYYIALMPAVIAGIVAFLHSKSRQLALAAAALFIIVFAIDINRVLYPYKDHEASRWRKGRSHIATCGGFISRMRRSSPP